MTIAHHDGCNAGFDELNRAFLYDVWHEHFNKDIAHLNHCCSGLGLSQAQLWQSLWESFEVLKADFDPEYIRPKHQLVTINPVRSGIAMSAATFSSFSFVLHRL